MEIYSLNKDVPTILENLGGSNNNTEYILKYCKSEKIGASFAVIERNYVDRDFCVDYSKYYYSSHSATSRLCRRVHFFKADSEESLRKLFGSSKNTGKLQERYCGFSVIDGIADTGKKGHLGRTVLCTYCGPKKECKKGKCGKSVYHTIPQKISLFGHELTVNALPFISKDKNVGMCATAALWVTQFPLIERHGGQRSSLYEITGAAATDGSSRGSSAGLTGDQMIRYLSERNYEVDSVITSDRGSRWMVKDAIKTFVDAKVPIIANLGFYRTTGKKERAELENGQVVFISDEMKLKVEWDEYEPDDAMGRSASPGEIDCEYKQSVLRNGLCLLTDAHATVISGYSLDENGKMDGIYIHDDNYGPYTRVKFEDNDGILWKYKAGEYADEIVCLHGLIIPLYPKIRLSYIEVANNLKCLRDQIAGSNIDAKQTDVSVEIKLAEGKNYKKDILENYDAFDDHGRCTGKIMEMLLPRFVWILRSIGNELIYDILLDSTATKDIRAVAKHYLKKRRPSRP